MFNNKRWVCVWVFAFYLFVMFTSPFFSIPLLSCIGATSVCVFIEFMFSIFHFVTFVWMGVCWGIGRETTYYLFASIFSASNGKFWWEGIKKFPPMPKTSFLFSQRQKQSTVSKFLFCYFDFINSLSYTFSHSPLANAFSRQCRHAEKNHPCFAEIYQIKHIPLNACNNFNK